MQFDDLDDVIEAITEYLHKFMLRYSIDPSMFVDAVNSIDTSAFLVDQEGWELPDD